VSPLASRKRRLVGFIPENLIGAHRRVRRKSYKKPGKASFYTELESTRLENALAPSGLLA